MSRTPLVIGAIVVLVAAGGLVMLLGGNAEDTAAAKPEAQPPATARPVEPPPMDHNPSVTVGDIPRIPGEARPAVVPGEDRTYSVGGMRVRDHRDGDTKPLDIPPNVHPANARLLPSSLTHAISTKVQEVVKECAAALPRDGRGAKPRLEGQVVVAITAQQMSVTDVTVQLRDVPEGAEVEAAKQCVQSKAKGLATAATDEADLERYTIRVSYALP